MENFKKTGSLAVNAEQLAKSKEIFDSCSISDPEV